MALPLIALIAGAALSSGAQIYSSIQQSNALQEQADSEEAMAAIRAQSLRREAEQERLNRLSEERAERRFARRRRAAAEASYAKSGVLLSGTPEVFMVEQAGVDELNIQQRNRDSEQKRKLIEVGAQNSLIAGMNRSSAYKSAATATLLGGSIGAFGGLATAYGNSPLTFSDLWGGKTDNPSVMQNPGALLLAGRN
jgi:hypothetical protein